MSEYIKIEAEYSDDGTVMLIVTNLNLSEEGVEDYHSYEEMEEGSPIALALSAVAGIAHIRIEDNKLTISRERHVPWYTIEADVSAILKDFFL